MSKNPASRGRTWICNVCEEWRSKFTACCSATAQLFAPWDRDPPSGAAISSTVAPERRLPMKDADQTVVVMRSSPWEDYNYKSLAAVAHTPGWNGTPVAGNRGVGQSSQLRIGCVFGSRNVTFCRVLHVSSCYHAATRTPRTRSIQEHHRSESSGFIADRSSWVCSVRS